MATQVQFRRGNTANMSTFTGAAGEITVDTDKKVVVVHDGTTAGGIAGVSATQLSGNLSSYVTTTNLTNNLANYVTSTNLTNNLANYVTSTNLTNNLANYQTTAGLNANIASYLPTYTGVVNGSSFTVSSSFVANSTGVYDSKGNVRTVVINNQTTGYTLVANDAGKCISITTGGVTVPNTVFSNGDTIVIYNNSASNQTITQGTGVTMYQVGTATTGNRTLAQRGLATLLCVVSGATPTFVISGGGLT